MKLLVLLCAVYGLFPAAGVWTESPANEDQIFSTHLLSDVIDFGYPTDKDANKGGRWWTDINGDGLADYCRSVNPGYDSGTMAKVACSLVRPPSGNADNKPPSDQTAKKNDGIRIKVHPRGQPWGGAVVDVPGQGLKQPDLLQVIQDKLGFLPDKLRLRDGGEEIGVESLREGDVLIATTQEDEALFTQPKSGGCPRTSPTDWQLPRSMTRLDTHNSGMVVSQCQLIDITGDTLPDYVCSFDSDFDQMFCLLKCVYRNTGTGWELIGGDNGGCGY